MIFKGGGVLTDLPVKYIVFPGHNLNMFKHTKGGVVLAAYNYEQVSKGRTTEIHCSHRLLVGCACVIMYTS